MTDGEKYDKYRSLTLTITSWIYHKDYPGKHEQETTNPFLLTENGPFTNTRKIWVNDATKTIIDKLTQIMIDEFGKKGISGPPGTNEGSLDWDYEIIDAYFDYKPGCAEADIVLYKEIQTRLAGYKKRIAKLDLERIELTKIKAKTNAQVGELRNVINQLERIFRQESGDSKQLDRLKEKCPDIEKMLD